MPIAATQSSAPSGHYPWLAAYPKDVDWHQAFKAVPVADLLQRAVQRHPNRVCTEFIGKTITYAEISALVDRAAAGLQKLGVKKGTRVGLFLPNTPTFIVFYYATLKIGGTVVNYNPLYSIEELAFQVKDSQTQVMVTLDLKLLFDKVETLLSKGALERAIVCSFSALLPGLKSVLFRLFKGKDLARVAGSPVRDKVVLEADVLSHGSNSAPVEIDPENDVAVLQYTGGTTGTPKGAMLTHANLTINVQQVIAWAPGLVDGEEKVLGVLPFFHVFAMTVVMNFGIAKASRMALMPRFVLDDALALITKSRPTVMPGVPTIFNAILNHKKLSSYNLSSLKFCLSGGAALPIEVKRGFEKLTGCKLVEGYGLSETSPVATANPLEGPIKDGSIGLPLPATFISLRAIDDPNKEVPRGEEGEICIKGPQVMAGYWNKPDETANVMLPGGYFRTGDIGTMDEEGFIFITDRLKDMINCSGFKVFPRYVEEKIYEHPAVEEVTVIGIKNAYRGEAPKAFIKLKAGQTLTKDALIKFLEPKLSKIELPEEVEFRPELPKTMIGKLSKKELKAEERAKETAAKGR